MLEMSETLGGDDFLEACNDFRLVTCFSRCSEFDLHGKAA